MQNPLANSSSGPPVTPDVSQRASALKRFIDRHPYWSALLIFAYFQLSLLLLHFLLAPLAARAHLPFLVGNLIGEVLIALVVAIPIVVLGWWSETGFTRGITWGGVVICLIPIVLIVLPGLTLLPGLAARTSLPMYVMTTVLVLLIGFAEEGLCRGLLLRSLLPKGIWTSVLISAGLFSIMHLGNLFSGFPLSYVVGQLLIAFGSGALFAAIRLRTRSIWPSLVLHAAHDFPGLLLLAIAPRLALSSSWQAVITVNGIFCLFLLLNAFVLLRPAQWRKLRVAYGLAPAPVTPPPGAFYPPYYPYPYPAYPQPYSQTPPYPGYVPTPQAYPPAPSEYVQPQAYPPPPSAYMPMLAAQPESGHADQSSSE